MFVESSVLAALAAALVAFSLSEIQAFLGSKAGSDHPAHIFLTNAIRSNDHRLFERIPGLLNTCFCGAIPLYTHWVLSHFCERAVFWAERLLNPIVNTMHVIVFAGIACTVARAEGLPTTYLALSAFAFALTPQFYHALSARNFGLSARGIGLVLLTLFFLTAYFAEADKWRPLWWVLLGLLGWMVWGFSTFAQQALCLISVILLVSTGRYVPLVGVVLGLALFIIVHRAFSLSYLRYTYKFLRAYATELAPIYILRKRKSIWRDLVWDIWLRFYHGLQRGALYAYENSVLVVLFLNPFVALACWLELTNHMLTGLAGYAGALALAGGTAALLTSFRPTRFLGEPERYAEAVAPWAVLYATHFVYLRWGGNALLAIILFCAAFNVMQLYVSRMLMKHASEVDVELDEVESAIASKLGDNVRFCSSNEQFTKLLMKNRWHFAYFWVVGQEYCGMTVAEAFSAFPSLKREACERIVSTYRVNACLLDLKLYDSLFDAPPPSLRGISTAYESARLRLLILDWADAPAVPGPAA